MASFDSLTASFDDLDVSFNDIGEDVAVAEPVVPAVMASDGFFWIDPFKPIPKAPKKKRKPKLIRGHVRTEIEQPTADATGHVINPVAGVAAVGISLFYTRLRCHVDNSLPIRRRADDEELLAIIAIIENQEISNA